MFRGLKDRFVRFMTGRRGGDELGRFLLVIWFAAAFINIFARSKVISVLQLIPAVFFFCRFFSADHVRRDAENRRYIAVRGKIKKALAFRVQQLKEIKTHRYIKCPKCRAVIRVPRKKGSHTLVCPKCGERFEVKIWL